MAPGVWVGAPGRRGRTAVALLGVGGGRCCKPQVILADFQRRHSVVIHNGLDVLTTGQVGSPCETRWRPGGWH